MKHLLQIFAIIAICLTIFVNPAFAHDYHEDEHNEISDHGHKPHQCLMAQYKSETGGFLLAYQKELSLTKSQVQTLKDMSKKLCERMHDRKEEIAREKANLRTMLQNSDLDLNAINNQMKKIYDMEYSFRKEALAEFQKARLILTPEQKVRLDKVLKEKIK